MQAFYKNNLFERLRKKSALIFFVKAKSNETMNSWICRNALSNYINPIDFVEPWVKNHSALNSDFDLNPNEKIVEWLLQMSPYRHAQLSQNLNLISLLQCFKYSRCRYSPIAIDTTPTQQKKIRPHFCPSCLQGKNKYFKLDWKFTLIFGCNECKCFLQSVCPKCEGSTHLMKLKFYQNDHFVTLNQCSLCFNTLHEDSIVTLSKSQQELNLWVSEILGLESKIDQNPEMVSLLFDLCNLLTSKNDLGKIVREYFSISIDATLFHQMPTNDRYYIIALAKSWIDNFYYFVCDINEKYNISKRQWDPHVCFPNYLFNP